MLGADETNGGLHLGNDAGALKAAGGLVREGSVGIRVNI
jgi:hypothetical protein